MWAACWLLLLAASNCCARSLFEESAGSEFLPEDTFRKLAAVLYQRGDRAEHRLTRRYLQVC